MSTCVLCDDKAVTTRQDNSSRTIYNCGRCGVYVVSDLAIKDIQLYRNEVCAYMRHRELAGLSDIVLVSYDKSNLDKAYLQLTVEQIVDQFPQSFAEQMAMSLVNLSLKSEYPGYEIQIDSLDLAPAFYLRNVNADALAFVIKALDRDGLIDVNHYGSPFFPCGIVVSPRGWNMVASYPSKKSGGRRSAMLVCNPDFTSSGDDVRTAARAMARECDLQLVTVGMNTRSTTIGNELAAQIKMSSYVMIDLSEVSPVCHYALGFAQALSKPLLLTCHQDERDNLMLDCAPRSIIFWKDKKHLQLEMYNFIKATE